MAKPEQTTDDIDTAAEKFCPTQVDIADCWYVDANWVMALSRFEYDLLYTRLKDKPLPWKILERKHRLSRQMLNIYINKALDRLFLLVKC